MPTRLISFGYRHGAPPSGCLLIDVRVHFARNPYRRGDLRGLSGLDPEVQADVNLTPHFEDSYKGLVARVLQANTDTVALGCTGGRHRSVYLAERLGADLHIPVEHRDINKLDFSNKIEPR